MPPNSSPDAQYKRKLQLQAEQIRLLYTNANAGTWVTISVATGLSYLQWNVISHGIVLAWLIYMLVISLARFILARRYWGAAAIVPLDTRRWGTTFTIGIGLSAAGWGTAGFLFYPETHLTNQVILAFVLGGMMLGAGSVVASRPEAFLTFMIPTGLTLSLRFLLQGDAAHLAMGFMAAIFTAATSITTWRIYSTLRSSLNLQFEKNELVADLQNAKNRVETLNQELEIRVQARTAELNRTNTRLQAEIEQRQQVEEELLRARKLEALGVLAGGIAHDFNNFLTIVQGNVGLAQMELGSESPVGETLNQIAAACQRAAALSSQLLTFSKGGAPVRRTVPMARLLKDAVDLARAGATIAFDIHIADDLWSAQVDASQMGQALHNILLNAREAMPGGGVIEVRADNVILETGSSPLAPGKYVQISVQDSGGGISPENLPRIFDPYFTTKRTGKGLGLAAAYAIVAKHQGRLTVESAASAGTTFRIYLPASEQGVPSEPQGDDVLRRGSGRILVMDDEEPIRKMLSQTLRRLGYDVDCASDGAEAIALYENAETSGQAFDAVLLDLTVPGGMGGLVAGAKLREMDPLAKLIASSGYSDAPVMSECHKYGFDDVIPKPWTAEHLSEVFGRVLQANRPPSKP